MSAAPRSALRAAIISGLGSGYAPFASGTWGSLVAVLIFLGLWVGARGAVWPRGSVEPALAILIVAACFFSVRWGPWAIAHYGRKDPKPFVLDEFAGQWVALLFLPIGLHAGLWPLALAVGSQFLLFRFFDIWKPPPARQLEQLPDGWGVLCDDLFAGVYANLAGQALWRLTPAAAWLTGAAS